MKIQKVYRKSGATVRSSLVEQGRDACSELNVSVEAPAFGSFGEQFEAVLAAWEAHVHELGFVPDSANFVRVFVSDAANQEAVVRDSRLTKLPIALSIVEQPPAFGRKLALLAYHTKSPREERTPVPGGILVRREGRGHLWSVCSRTPNHEGSDEQTSALLRSTQSLLGHFGGRLRDHTVRTWFFVADIDSEYAGLVASRKRLFEAEGLTAETHYITSTGIAGRSAVTAQRVLLESYSILGSKEGDFRFLTAPEHLGPTHLYGVTFERGTRVRYADRDHVFISGTASIDPAGNTLHLGDVERQVERTLDNIDALLRDGEMGPESLAHAVIYLRDSADEEVVRRALERRWPERPFVYVRAAVCRPSWLVEIECFAIRARSSDESGAGEARY